MNAIPQTHSPSPQISHESETQRQHVRFSLPAQAYFNGKEYEVKDISSGGICLQGATGVFSQGKLFPLTVRFAFDGFFFGSRLEAEVRHIDTAKNTIGCRFINLGAQQISFLNYIIKSYIAGDVVTSGGLLNVAARNNFVKPRTTANANASPPGLRRQLPGLLAVAGLGMLIIAFIAQSLYNSVFTVRSDDAAVAAPVVAVRAASGGIFRSQLNPDLAFIKQNQVIGTLAGTGTGNITIQSPCNCYISKAHVTEGEMVTAGSRILSLTPIDATPWIIAAIDPTEAKRVGPATKVSISIFGSPRKYSGHLLEMEAPLSGDTGNKNAMVKIALDEKLPVSFVNRLASVTFSLR